MIETNVANNKSQCSLYHHEKIISYCTSSENCGLILTAVSHRRPDHIGPSTSAVLKLEVEKSRVVWVELDQTFMIKGEHHIITDVELSLALGPLISNIVESPPGNTNRKPPMTFLDPTWNFLLRWP